ncbi:hypothetical protein BKA70DRAFT_1229980 [Coprinopsis sp. MPI-PUGE-AT-0042]|nr:hypothetical protein BKA70DRAFT_1229980 [Coprinopsis sp. MPI-PUGE-AT-0042]
MEKYKVTDVGVRLIIRNREHGILKGKLTQTVVESRTIRALVNQDEETRGHGGARVLALMLLVLTKGDRVQLSQFHSKIYGIEVELAKATSSYQYVLSALGALYLPMVHRVAGVCGVVKDMSQRKIQAVRLLNYQTTSIIVLVFNFEIMTIRLHDIVMPSSRCSVHWKRVGRTKRAYRNNQTTSVESMLVVRRLGDLGTASTRDHHVVSQVFAASVAHTYEFSPALLHAYFST